MNWTATLNLDKGFFSEKEKLFAVNGKLKAYLFLFDSGVYGLKIENEWGYIITLPYQGQQIWRCNFLDRELTMDSTFPEPVLTGDYLSNYGGFLLHCGATAMGVPSHEDEHPLHGELPNAPYTEAFIELGEDHQGKYMSLGGEYRHTVAFNSNYLAEPSIKIYEGSSLLDVTMNITNLKHTDMELMYMMHINFKPIDNGQLIYSADYTREDVKVHVSIPTHMQSGLDSQKLVEFLYELEDRPQLHHVLDPSLPFDPEIVFIIKYMADNDGNAHSMQLHPDGYANYVSHRPSQLKYGVRWICRTKDEDALGLVLPSTAGHRGYSTEKELGNIEIVPALEKVEFNVKLGILDPSQAAIMRVKIESLQL